MTSVSSLTYLPIVPPSAPFFISFTDLSLGQQETSEDSQETLQLELLSLNTLNESSKTSISSLPYELQEAIITLLPAKLHFKLATILRNRRLQSLSLPQIPKLSVNECCYNGNTAILDLWLETKLPSELTFASYVLSYAVAYGKLEVLKWWKSNGLELIYFDSTLPMDRASGAGFLEILKWLKDESGMEIKYSDNAIYWASYNGHVDVLEFWKNSGLPIFEQMNPYTNFLDVATHNGHVDVLEWWLKSGYKLQYSYDGYMFAKMSRKRELIEWWEKSGLVKNND
ncbi:hypothetical protein HK098_003335 [Nowakowskiella sp. JEL0407]|nr:hypothetical protein HK098_003335 [Nowakowskiella sp. JEL0407]